MGSEMSRPKTLFIGLCNDVSNRVHNHKGVHTLWFWSGICAGHEGT
jgi:predicted GIY-YIG superfamily endonuclease